MPALHLVVASVLALAGPAAAQSAETAGTAADGAPGGGLDLPPPPPLRADSPRDSIEFADRVEHRQDDDAQYGSPGAGTIQKFTLPAGPNGTGTLFPETFRYQIPVGYDPLGSPVPLCVGYHGYGQSSLSVSNLSTIDEECNARGWFYLAPTGLDDKLFGSAPCQQHIDAAIQWMLDTFHVDADRVYMVGFSMGGGVCANYAARHRDPDGIMIAALGSVAGTFDWSLAWFRSEPSLQFILEHPYNFGGTPEEEPFTYQAFSSLYFAPPYPPTLGALDTTLSMASNLHATPTYLTYDVADIVLDVVLSNVAFESLLQSVGGSPVLTVVTGTVDPGPPVVPAPHSWLVLNEVALFDFFADKTADRLPAVFQAQQAAGGPVSWVITSVDLPETFVYVAGDASDAAAGQLAVDGLGNARELSVDAGAAGVQGVWPVRVTTSNDDSDPVRLRLAGFDLPPSRLHDAKSGALITLVDSDPLGGALLRDVAGGATLDAHVVHDPEWTTVLTITPDPAVPLGPVSIAIDGPASSSLVYLLICGEESLLFVEGVFITALPVPPSLILLLPLDRNGDVTLNETIPDVPGLTGLRLPTQAVTVTAGGVVESVSNLWGFRID